MRKKNQWGVKLGKPNMKLFNDIDIKPSPNIGLFMIGFMNGNKILLYDTRAEARVSAKAFAEYNSLWKYHAAKYDP